MEVNGILSVVLTALKKMTGLKFSRNLSFQTNDPVALENTQKTLSTVSTGTISLVENGSNFLATVQTHRSDRVAVDSWSLNGKTHCCCC